MDAPVLLTGANGRVGRAIRDGIAEAYDWHYLFHNPPDEEPEHPYTVADVTDYEAMRAAVDGCGAVIHLAGDPRRDAPWRSVLDNNIDGTKQLLDACVDAGVEKFAFASSNHAVGAFEDDRTPDIYRTHDDFRLDGTELPRPGNLYGVSKATGEVLGRYYHDKHDLKVVCVRIGNLTADRPPEGYERGQAMWLSHRDCAHLFDRCLQADYGYEIVYGISDNDRKYYSIDRARDVLGYEPRDNSAEFEDAETE